MNDQFVIADVYAAVRARMAGQGRSLSTGQAAAMVPASPDWTVRDVYAHVVGINDDIIAARLDGIGSDAWTAAQVDRRRALTIDQICDEWESLAPAIDAVTTADPFLGLRMLADLVVHDHDIAAALGIAPEREGAATELALDRYAPTFVERAESAGGAAVVCDGGVWGDPHSAAVTVSGTAFDLLRSIAGRRTATQIRDALVWSADPAPWLGLVSTYGSPERPVE